MRPRLSILILIALGPLTGCGAVARGPAGAATALQPVPPPVLPIDRPLPDVPLRRLDGSAARLGEVLAGRPALVSLWATWCEACTEEFAALGRLHAGAPARAGALAVVGLSVGEPVEAVAAFARREGLAWAALCDPEFQFADALGEKRVPTTLVVSAAGRITFVGGQLDGAALAALRRELEPAR